MKPDKRDSVSIKITKKKTYEMAHYRGYVWRYYVMFVIITIGCLLLMGSSLPAVEEAPSAVVMEQDVRTDAKKISSEAMERMCNEFARLHWERMELEEKKSGLLEQITDAKARLDSEISPIKRSFTRKEIDRLATRWYEHIEKSQKAEGEERRLLRIILKDKEAFRNYLRRRLGSIEKEIQRQKKAPEINAQRMARLEKRRERINLTLKLLDRLKDEPELLEEIICASPKLAPRVEPPPPARLQFRIRRLEKEIHFLRSRLERYEQELEGIKRALRMRNENDRI